MSDFRKLAVWQKSMELVSKVYPYIKKLPAEERFCLGQQLRNCSVSIPSNIAEGHGRESTKEFIHHLNFSRGSTAELETQLLICVMLDYLKENDLKEIFDSIHLVDAMLNKLIASLKKRL